MTDNKATEQVDRELEEEVRRELDAEFEREREILAWDDFYYPAD